MKVYSDKIACLSVLLIVTGTFFNVELLQPVYESNSHRAPILIAWWEASRFNSVQGPDIKIPVQQITLYSQISPEVRRFSLITKSYYLHNQLYFNIPITCCKFPVSQFTADG